MNRRKRGNTSESPLGSKSNFRLVAIEETPPDTVENIHDFESFKRLRHVYDNLCELPETLFADWITCCRDHIALDIDGKNTQEENQQNVRIGTLFEHFKKQYEHILGNEKDPVTRRTKINESLLELLRSLLGKPCRLSDEILTLTI